MRQIWKSCDGLTFETEEACRGHEIEYYSRNKERAIALYNALKTLDKWCVIMNCEGCPIETMCEKCTGGSSWIDYLDKTAREVIESEGG